MLSMKTDYSHVSWIFWNSDNTKPRYYESVLNGGVKFTGQRPWENRNLVVFRKDFLVTDEMYETFLDEAMDMCGVEYGMWQNLGIKLASIFALAKNIFANGDDYSNCSELILKFKDKVGLHLEEDQDLVDPRDIVEACRRLG